MSIFIGLSLGERCSVIPKSALSLRKQWQLVCICKFI